MQEPRPVVPVLEDQTMRAMDCPCGEYIEARNDGEVLDAVKRHASEEHEGTYSEAELKILVDTSAYDVAARIAAE